MRNILKIKFFAAACLLAVAGCSKSAVSVRSTVTQAGSPPQAERGSAGSVSWISPELGLTPGKTVASALQEPFEDVYEVTLSQPKDTKASLHNCAEYLKEEKNLYDTGGSLQEEAIESDGARCDALHMLEPLNISTHPDPGGFSLKNVSVGDLPPGMALVVAREQDALVDQATKKGGGIRDIESTASFHAKDDEHAVIDAKDWTARLVLYARGDLLGDGKEELLVRRDASVKKGTYASTDLFILSRSADGKLRIEHPHP